MTITCASCDQLAVYVIIYAHNPFAPLELVLLGETWRCMHCSYNWMQGREEWTYMLDLVPGWRRGK